MAVGALLWMAHVIRYMVRFFGPYPVICMSVGKKHDSLSRHSMCSCMCVCARVCGDACAHSGIGDWQSAAIAHRLWQVGVASSRTCAQQDMRSLASHKACAETRSGGEVL